ncbi:hypothetical protein F4679DRAFT_583308 [Xylaria curta]|nr:hypothetical protein F4679DRAFT_583308 [Xylaria curta]
MSEATQELRLQLSVEEGSQTNIQDSSSILWAFKRNASFTLKRKKYEGILSRLQASNTTIQNLVGLGRNLEPQRRQRSQSQLTKLLRSLLNSIHNALCSAIPCACAHSHSIGLQLCHRNAVILPNDVEEEIAQRFDFRVTFRISNEYRTTQMVQHANKAHWKDFQLRLMRDDVLPLTPVELSLTSITISPRPKIRWPPSFTVPSVKKRRLSPSTTHPVAQTSMPLQATTKTTEVPPPRVLDLCDIACKGPKAKSMKCYGYVLDTQRKFILSHPDDDHGPQEHITLRQVINGNIPGLPLFDFEDKVQVALALSASVLHLDGTSWLSQVVTLVFMICSENIVNHQHCLRYRPFIVKSVLNTLTHQGTTPPVTLPTPPKKILGVGRPVSPAVLSLGSLLIQIMIGRVENELEMTDTMDICSIFSKRERARKLGHEVLLNGGMNYATAVNWCLDSIDGVAGLQNDTFCRHFYEAVVARFEDDLRMIASDV